MMNVLFQDSPEGISLILLRDEDFFTFIEAHEIVKIFSQKCYKSKYQ